mgnify:CR=1 FL=1
MWLENTVLKSSNIISVLVSILLLLDVAGKHGGDNPDMIPADMFQSFFFWMWLENLCRPRYIAIENGRFNPSSSGCGWKTLIAYADEGRQPGFQSFFFWMWLENEEVRQAGSTAVKVSILLLLDVAGKQKLPETLIPVPERFNPSSSGCGWKTNPGFQRPAGGAGFQSFFFWMWLENFVYPSLRVEPVPGFNPSSSGCGWKTTTALDSAFTIIWFQSFFFWMWLENRRCRGCISTHIESFNPSSSGCGWKTCLYSLFTSSTW